MNGIDPELARRRPHFDSLVPVFPDEMFDLETDPKNLTQRLINLIAPVGKGQRGLILSPAKAGKTTVLKNIAHGITENHKDALLMVALIGERPEEVTDMQRSVQGEIYASTFDEPTENHTRVAEMTLEIAKRQVETGRDVVILDSITRLARAYNLPAGIGQDPVRWRGSRGPLSAQALLRRGAEHRGRRQPDRSSPPAWWTPARGWTTSSTRSSRAPATWSSCSTASSARSGSSRPRRPALRDPSRGASPRRQHSEDGVDHARMLSAVGPNEGIELLMQRLGKTKNNSEFLVSLSRRASRPPRGR